MAEKTKKARLVATISPELLERLDAVCERIHVPRPNRSAAVEEALTTWVGAHEELARLGEEAD
jgi:metal-responsive CopG/Arc/MetJ family transcriptional regulator